MGGERTPDSSGSSSMGSNNTGDVDVDQLSNDLNAWRVKVLITYSTSRSTRSLDGSKEMLT